MKRVFYVFIAIVSLYSYCRAQVPNANTISGTIVDENNKALPLVTVALLATADSVIVAGTTTSGAGTFNLTDIPFGEYRLKISCIGYKSEVISSIVVSREKSNIDIGTRALVPESHQTTAVQVTGERATEEYHADKKVINVAQTLTAVSGTAVDVLRNQPSVQVDGDGNVTLRGSSNFAVQVNGRPSVLQGSDALKQIPANLIDKIELITNPSAAHDAEGSAGIINIILKKQTENSYSGILNNSAGSRDKYSSDLTANYRAESVSASLGYDYRNNNNLNHQDINRVSQTTSGAMNNYTGIQIRVKRENYAGRGSFDYTFADKSVLTINGITGGINMRFNANSNIVNWLDPTPASYSHNFDDNRVNVRYYNAGLFYSRSFTPTVDEISFDASFTRVAQPQDEDVSLQATNSSFTGNGSAPILSAIDNDTKRWDARFKSNYKYTFSPASIFECGVQGNLFYKTIDYHYSDYDYATNSWISNAGKTNAYDFRNNIAAGFVTYSGQAFGVDYKAGLRAEYNDRNLKQTTLGNAFTFTKFDLFPTFSVSAKLSDTRQLQFSYSRRINRPFDQALNPFPQYSDPYITSVGNPNLRPEYTHSVELNFQNYWTGYFLSVQTYFRRTLDGMSRSFDNQNGRLILSFANLASSTQYGAEISGSATITDWWRLDPGVNIFESASKGVIASTDQNDKMFTWNARLNSTFTLGADTRLQFTGYYNAKNIISQGFMKQFAMFSVSLKQDFFEKALSVNVQAQNVFRPLNFTLETSGSNFVSSALVNQEAPVYMLTISYNFNNFKRSARGPERVDVNVGEGL